MPDGRLRRAWGWTLDGSETSAAPVSPADCIRLRSNAAGTAIEVSYDQGAYVTLAGSSGKWNAIANPDGNQALTMAAYTSTWTWNAATGATTDLFVITNTTDDTGTGSLVAINTPGTANAKKPLTITAQTNAVVQVAADGTINLTRAITSAAGPTITFYKYRNTLAAKWNVASGDSVGTLAFIGGNDTGGSPGDEAQLGSFSCIAARDLTESDYGGGFRWQTKDSAESVALRNRMWLTSLGYLGVGQNLAATDVTDRVTITNGTIKHYQNSGTWEGFLGTVGSDDYQGFGYANETDAVSAATHIPQWNVQSHVKPNGSGTGYNYIFKTVRHDGGTLGSLSGLCSYIESDETDYHEIIAGNDFVNMLAGSTGSGFGRFIQAATWSDDAGATGLEINVQNLRNVSSPYYGVDGVSAVGGVQGIILTAFKSADAGDTLSEYCSNAITISYGQPYDAGPGGGASNGTQFKAGIWFTESSIGYYGIDFGTMESGAPAAIRLGRSQWVLGRNNANSADVNLFKLNSANELEFGGEILIPSGSVVHKRDTDLSPQQSMYAWGAGVPILLYHKAKGTVGSPTALASGDRLAQFRFSGNYDTTVVPGSWNTDMIGAIFQADASGTWDSTHTPADFAFRVGDAKGASSKIVTLLIHSDNRVGIGSGGTGIAGGLAHADVTETLTVLGNASQSLTSTTTSATNVKGASFAVTHSPGGSSSATIYGIYSTVSQSTTQAATSKVGQYLSVAHTPASNAGVVIGQQIDLTVSGGGGSTATTVEGQTISVSLSGKAVSTVYGLAYTVNGGVTGSITTAYGAYVGISNGLMATTTAYGLYVEVVEGATITNKYAIVTPSGSGKIGFNTITPSADLHHVGSFRVDVGSDATGDMWYRAATTGLATRISTSGKSAGNVLTLYDSGGGVLLPRWDTAAGGGANTALSNLASVSINASLIPQTTLDLGANTTAWRNLYIYGAGTYGSHSFKLHGTPTGHRTITFPDVSDTVVVPSLSHTFTDVQAITASATTTSSTHNTLAVTTSVSPASSSTAIVSGIRNTITTTTAQTQAVFYGFYSLAEHAQSSGITTVYGAFIDAVHSGGGGTIGQMFGADIKARVSSSGTLTAASAVSATVTCNTGTITTGYGVNVLLSRGSGTFTTGYGVYIDASGTITNKYALVTTAGAGNVGIGTISPAVTLDVAGRTRQTETRTDTAAGVIELNRQAITLSPASSSSTTFYLLDQDVTCGTAQNITSIYGIRQSIAHAQNSTLSTVYGINQNITHSSGTLTTPYAAYCTMDLGAGTTSMATGAFYSLSVTGATVTDAVGVRVDGSRSSGTFTKYTAFHATYSGTITTKYGFISSSGFLHGFGTLTPTAFVEIDAGTSSVAPLKLNSGTNLSSPVNGTFEYDGTNLYFTTGGTRKTVTLV